MTRIAVLAEPVAVRAETAAQMLGVSRDYFDEHVAPDLRCVDLGRIKLYATATLREWVAAREAIPAGR